MTDKQSTLKTTPAQQMQWLQTQVLGNKENLELMLAAVLSPYQANVLIMGSPGTSKTTAVKLVAKLVDASFAKIQATPNLDINKVLGPVNLQKLLTDKTEQIDWSAWVNAEVKFIDEFNRMTPESAVSLMEVMDTSRGERHLHINQHAAPQLPSGPMFATMNYSDAGTNEVFPPMMDRFDIALSMNHAKANELLWIAGLNSGSRQNIPMPTPWSQEDLKAARADVLNITVPDTIQRFVSCIIRDMSYCKFGEMEMKTSTSTDHCARECFICPKISQNTPSSPRMLISLLHMAKALAYVRGGKEVTIKEIRSLMTPIMRHRIKLQTAYVKDFKNINDAYEKLGVDLEKRQIHRDEYSAIVDELREHILTNQKPIRVADAEKWENLQEFMKNDGVYKEFATPFVSKLATEFKKYEAQERQQAKATISDVEPANGMP